MWLLEQIKSTIEILATLNTIDCNSAKIFFKLFDAQVVPTLLYGPELWRGDKFDQIERVHLYACKRFLHVLDKTPNDIVYGELGRYPLWITSVSKSIKYWFRLLKQPENFWSKKAYNMSPGLHEKLSLIHI